MPAPDSIPMPDLSKVLWPLTTLQPRPAPAERKPRPESQPRRPGVDVGAIITRALTAAGLMK